MQKLIIAICSGWCHHTVLKFLHFYISNSPLFPANDDMIGKTSGGRIGLQPLWELLCGMSKEFIDYWLRHETN